MGIGKEEGMDEGVAVGTGLVSVDKVFAGVQGGAVDEVEAVGGAHGHLPPVGRLGNGLHLAYALEVGGMPTFLIYQVTVEGAHPRPPPLSVSRLNT
jgi:hypothetical protein